MKTTAFKTVALVILIIITGFSFPSSVLGQAVLVEIEQVGKFRTLPTEKGLIISSREVRLKTDVNSKDFENWVIEYWNPEWQDLIPGFQSYIAKGKEDLQENQYSYYLVFNSNRIRNYPLSNTDQNTVWYREMFYYEPTKHLFEELFEYIEVYLFFTKSVWYEVK